MIYLLRTALQIVTAAFGATCYGTKYERDVVDERQGG